MASFVCWLCGSGRCYSGCQTHWGILTGITWPGSSWLALAFHPNLWTLPWPEIKSGVREQEPCSNLISVVFEVVFEVSEKPVTVWMQFLLVNSWQLPTDQYHQPHYLVLHLSVPNYLHVWCICVLFFSFHPFLAFSRKRCCINKGK